jgi:cyanophycinase
MPTTRLRRLALPALLTLALGGCGVIAPQSPAPAEAAALVGPSRGALVVAGGGRLGPEILTRFLELAGGPGAPIVVIPTASGEEEYGPGWNGLEVLRAAGATNLAVLHTYDPETADTEEFVRPLRAARGVWFPGGRQWRLADAYLNTRTHRELRALLARGGVIGGTSAGASIQGSYLVRGAPEGNHIVMAPGHEEGLGLLRGTAIDQHLLARGRQRDLLQVLDRYPALLGIGIDEGTAIVVQGDRFEVVGASRVAVYGAAANGEGDEPILWLDPGARFDLRTRRPHSGDL